MLLPVLLSTVMVWGQAFKPEELCKLDGVVKHAVTGEPVRKASLTLLPMDQRGAVVPATTTTNAEGKFSMKDIEPGQYRFSVEKAGFVRSQYGATASNRQGTTLTLVKGQSMKDIEFRVQPHAVITGRVFDEDGDPVPWAQVQLLSYRTMQGKRQLMPSGGASTNDLGEYRMFGIGPGRYYISVSQRPFGMAVSGVDRSAVQVPDESYPTTYYPGTVDVSGATRVNVAVGATLQGMDIPLRKVRAFRIRGRVTGVASGARGGEVSVIPKGTSEFMAFSMMRNSSVWRGPSGEFELRGVRPGTYTVRAMSFESGKQSTGRETVEVTERDVENVTITISPGVEVSGSIRVESDVPVDAKIEDINVMLAPVEMGQMSMAMPGKASQDGGFRVTNVSGMQPEFYIKSVRLGDVDVMEHGLTVTGTGVSGLEVVISPKGAEVTGTVANKDGKLLPGAVVVLDPQFGGQRRLTELQKVLTADQNGSFRMRGVVPGEYKLYAFEEVDAYEVGDFQTLKEHESKAVTLSLKEGAREQKELNAVLLEIR